MRSDGSAYYAGSSGGPFLFHQLDHLDQDDRTACRAGLSDSLGIRRHAVDKPMPHVPSPDVARAYIVRYLRHVSWMYNVVNLEQLTDIFQSFYGVDLGLGQIPGTSSPVTPRILPPAEVAILFGMLALGATVLGDPGNDVEADRRHWASSLIETTANCLREAKAEQNPSITACKAMHLQMVSECTAIIKDRPTCSIKAELKLRRRLGYSWVYFVGVGRPLGSM
jgi:hypothetical protein